MLLTGVGFFSSLLIFMCFIRLLIFSFVLNFMFCKYFFIGRFVSLVLIHVRLFIIQ